jgi:hypothetical protein
MGRLAGVPQIADSWPKTLLLQALQQTFGPPEAGKRKHHDHEYWFPAGRTEIIVSEPDGTVGRKAGAAAT